MRGVTGDEIFAVVERRRAAWAARNPAALAATYTETSVVASPTGGVLEGRAEIERVYRTWFSAFPDIVLEPDEVLIDGNRVVQIARLVGTHAGEFFGLAPTGRHVEVQLAVLMKIENDLVVEERRIYDFTGVLVPIGVLKTRPGV